MAKGGETAMVLPMVKMTVRMSGKMFQVKLDFRLMKELASLLAALVSEPEKRLLWKVMDW